LFPVLLALLERDASSPGRRIWLAVPLVAVWGNLHGAVLAGLGLLGAYLVFSRGRREPLLSGAVFAAAVVASCLTPALWNTPRYYGGGLRSGTARPGEGPGAAPRGRGGWSPPPRG